MYGGSGSSPHVEQEAEKEGHFRAGLSFRDMPPPSDCYTYSDCFLLVSPISQSFKHLAKYCSYMGTDHCPLQS